MPWTKEVVLGRLQALREETIALESWRRLSEDHTRWLISTLQFVEDVFGPRSRTYLGIASLRWEAPRPMIVGGPSDPMGSIDPDAARERKDQEGYVRDLATARGVLAAAIERLNILELDEVYEGKDSGPESSAIVKVINLAEHKLRKVIRAKPSTEKEVQDAFEGLLIGADLPYSRETDRIEYSSKTYQPDFTMTKLDLAIDMKLCARDGREKELPAEINDDILAYQAKYGNLLFIVYDVGFIRDVERFADSFEQHQNVVVRVVKH